MFIFHTFQEDNVLVTYKSIVQSYADLQKHNAMMRDTLRKEAKDLIECYIRSLDMDSRVINTAKGKKEIVSIEQMARSGEYTECSPLALDMSSSGTLAFRVCMIIASLPQGNTIIPAYIQIELYEGMIKVELSLSNNKSDRRAELYVTRGDDVERYTEVAEHIKGMMMQFIADQKV